MPTAGTAKWPKPKSEDEFEDIVLDALKIRWGDPNATRNGRRGQRQNGVDVFGKAKHLDGAVVGAQCKNTESPTLSQLIEEVGKATSFKPALSEFLFVAAADRDVEFQESARLHFEENPAPFPVEVVFWNDLIHEMNGSPELFESHWPILAAQVEPDGDPLKAGWVLVDEDLLAAEQSDLNDRALNRYFDGAVPRWRHALSPSIPRRQLVDRLVEEFEARGEEPSGPLYRLLLGAGGEGKSTALLQVAADIARREGWSVLWRPEPEIGFDPAAFLSTADNEHNYLFVLDDAETAVAWLFSLARALSSSGATNVHVLGCARDFDWKRLKADRKAWSSYVEYDVRRLRGIRSEDAERIVAAWQAVPPEGRPLDVDGAGLTEVSRKEAVRGEGSFFGGVLAARFSPQGLMDHVKNMMSRLDEQRVGSATLKDALAYASMCHAVGIPGLDHRVLGDLLGVRHEGVRTQVERPLGDEAGAVRAGTALWTRHRRIAEVVVHLLDKDFDEDLGAGYSAIVRQTIETTSVVLSKGGQRIWPHGHVVHCGPRLVRNLPSSIPEDTRCEVAVAAARAACEAEPERLSYVVDLARAWRTAKEPEEAAEVFRQVTPTPEAHTDYDDLVRGFYYEWSVAEGQAKRKENNVWLAAYSLSDDLGPPVTWADAKTCLAGLGVALLDLTGKSGTSAVAKGMRACAVLGPKTRPDQKTTSYFDRYRKRANQNGVSHPADDAEAVAWLAEAVEAARSGVSDTLLTATGDQRLSFGALGKRLGVRTK